MRSKVIVSISVIFNIFFFPFRIKFCVLGVFDKSIKEFVCAWGRQVNTISPNEQLQFSSLSKSMMLIFLLSFFFSWEILFRKDSCTISPHLSIDLSTLFPIVKELLHDNLKFFLYLDAMFWSKPD
jgi:hypothetical protein